MTQITALALPILSYLAAVHIFHSLLSEEEIDKVLVFYGANKIRTCKMKQQNMKVQWLGVNNLTVQFFKIILAGSNLVFDDQSVRSRKI